MARESRPAVEAKGHTGGGACSVTQAGRGVLKKLALQQQLFHGSVGPWACNQWPITPSQNSVKSLSSQDAYASYTSAAPAAPGVMTPRARRGVASVPRSRATSAGSKRTDVFGGGVSSMDESSAAPATTTPRDMEQDPRAAKQQRLEAHRGKVAKRVQSQMAARALEIERKQREDDKRLQERCLALMEGGQLLSRLSEDELHRQEANNLRRIGDRHRAKWDNYGISNGSVGAHMAQKRLAGCSGHRLNQQSRVLEDFSVLLELDRGDKQRPKASRRFNSIGPPRSETPADFEEQQLLV